MDQSFCGHDTGNTRLPRRLLGPRLGYVTFRDSGVRCTLGRVSNLYAPIPAVSLGRGTRCNFEGFYELVRIRHPAKQSLNNQKGCFVIASRQTVSYRLTHTIRQQHA